MLCIGVSCDTVCLYYSFDMSTESEKSPDNANPDKTSFLRQILYCFSCKKSSSSKSERSSEYDVSTAEQSSEKSSDNDDPNKTSFLRQILSCCSCKNSKSERSSEDDASADEQSEIRTWSTELDLIINCIGFSVGLGNLWRFPYVAFKHGGGAFLIPYLILTFAVSFPLYYAELLIGQFSRLDPVSVWSLCPFFRGVGITIMLCNLVIQVYYNVVMGYALFYLFHSLRLVLPWAECFKWWGANDNCYDMKSGVVPCQANSSSPIPYENCTNSSETATDQFWRIYVLELSSGLDDPGYIKWHLVHVLFLSWVVVCALVILRHHSSSTIKIKTIYFTALFPFFILTIYLMYATTLPGAVRGLEKLFIPKWSSLLDITVWSEAAQSSLYSAGVGMGGLIIFGSKTDFNYNASRCAFISTFVDLLAGIFAATVTFMVVGFLAEQFEMEFSSATLSGHGLVFVTFPNVVINMYMPQLWAFAFFSMLFCLAVDASVAVTQTLTLGLHILFCRTSDDKIPFVVLISALLFFAGLSCVTEGGAFVLNILDTYAGGYSLLGTVMLESIAFGWGYGIKQASEDIKIMQGSEPHVCMKICWAVLAPVTLIVMFCYTTPYATLTPLYNIAYPSYANIIGWTILSVILLPVPVFMVIVLFQYRKNLQNAFKPDEIWKAAIHQSKEE